MSGQETIFGGQHQQTQQAAPSIEIPAEVQELVGEGKKYADVPTALKALLASQQHINTIQAENEQLREVVKKSKTVDDIFDVVSNQSNQQESQRQTTPVDSGKVVTEVLDVLKKQDEEKSAANNVKAASDQLVALNSGDKEAARKALEKKANELGVGVDFLVSVAAKSPKAFMSYFGQTQAQTESGSSSTDSSVNAQSLQVTRAAQEGTKEWWNAQRREHGDNWYFAPAQAKKRLDDAGRLGRAGFYGKQ